MPVGLHCRIKMQAAQSSQLHFNVSELMAREREKRIRSEEEMKKNKRTYLTSLGTETLILPFSSFLRIKGQFLENDNETFHRLTCPPSTLAPIPYSSLTSPLSTAWLLIPTSAFAFNIPSLHLSRLISNVIRSVDFFFFLPQLEIIHLFSVKS